MCDRTLKIKKNMNKSILTDVNSNTNVVELNVKPITLGSKYFGRHADTGPISDICDRIEEDIKNITKQNDK